MSLGVKIKRILNVTVHKVFANIFVHSVILYLTFLASFIEPIDVLAPAPEEGDHQEQRHHDEVHEGEDQLGAELLLLPIRVYKHCATVQVQLLGVM